MRSLLLMVIFTATLASLTEAQQSPDPRVADLVQAGQIRVGVHSVMYTTDSRTGELKAASTGIILLDIARMFGTRIGVEVQPVGHPTIPEMLTCLTAGECDMGFMEPDRSRVGVEFTPPILQLDYTFLVPAGSSIQSIADADRPGVRIAVVRDHASTLTLSRAFTHAQLIYAATPDPTFELLRTVVAKGQTARLDYLSEFIEQANASGLVQQAIDRAGLPGHRVAPAKTN